MLGTLLGGIGLFLLGMGLLTDGLTAAAGDALRRVLKRSTRTRLSALLSGTLATALMQSSSAVTVMTIGFVGAGLLPFAQALGVVYGANVGTTATSWIIATVGLKLQMSAVALPLVGVGAAGKLFLRGRRAALATALAGFGLLFVGIDVLQTGMKGLSEHIDPSTYAGQGILGDVALVLVGAVMTVVMQSSSAAVATTLTAVHSGAIGIEEAAALVIGQNIGTTVTALIGSIGGSIATRRIAGAHLIFNLGTGVVALGMLPVFVRVVLRALDDPDPAVALTAFHSAFNVLGVLIFLPLTDRLVVFLQRVLPDPGYALTRRLSAASATSPMVAVEAARQTTLDVASIIIGRALRLLAQERTSRDGSTRIELLDALGATREHLRRVRTDPSTPTVYREHLSVLHALDHLQQLLAATTEHERARHVRALPGAEIIVHELGLRLQDAQRWLADVQDDDVTPLAITARTIARFRREHRHVLLEQTARGQLDPSAAEEAFDALRWLERVGYHAYRATAHLERAALEPHEESGATPAQADHEPHDL